ncbi:MAG: 3-oxoacyl-ACP synthase [Paracoccaceae bacterium]
MSRLHIKAAGMVTAVGLDAASACAAMRARLDGFGETRFLGAQGGWLVGAPVPLPRNWIGQMRMARLLAGAISEVFRKVPAAEGNATLILCLAEETRPGRPVPDPEPLLRLLSEIVGLAPDTKTRVVAHGRPSGFVALQQARRLITEGAAQNVLIAGVDSYLTTLTVAHYLESARILGPGNANGFIPGEAAAAILCTAGEGPLCLTGLGLAREEAFIYNDMGTDGDPLPLRGDGMTNAYAQAFDAAGIEMRQLGYRISDLIGESYFFKQTALASIRLLRGRHDFQGLWSPAESVGNIGAAAVPLMIGMALAAAAKGYHGGDPVLIEASGDDGACGAALFTAGGQP